MNSIGVKLFQTANTCSVVILKFRTFFEINLFLDHKKRSSSNLWKNRYLVGKEKTLFFADFSYLCSRPTLTSGRCANVYHRNRILKVGRYSRTFSIQPSSAQSRISYSQLPRTMSSQVLDIFKNGSSNNPWNTPLVTDLYVPDYNQLTVQPAFNPPHHLLI